jgi:tetratricopeptide (TPR) repeat protein
MIKTLFLHGTFVVVFILFISLLPTSSFCEIQTITHTVKQPFGGSQSPDDARIAAIAKAKREALERAGIYVESLLVVKNAIVEKDEILALTAGVLQAEVVSQKNYLTGDAFGIEVIVKVVVDTAVLEERVKKLLQDRTHLKQLQAAQKREKGLLQNLAKLEEENQRLTKQGQRKKGLEKQFQDVSQGLTAIEWFYKASSLWDGEKYTEPMKGIEYLNNAINLQKDYADAYIGRGIAYRDLGQYQRAIEDFNQAIRLKPDDAYAYNNRGVTYADHDQHQRAIEDFNQAIRLKPDEAYAYNNRGTAYSGLRQHQRAIEDFNQAIRLKPDYAVAYHNRGAAYIWSGNLTTGCRSLKRACELGECKGYEYFKTKGSCP